MLHGKRRITSTVVMVLALLVGATSLSLAMGPQAGMMGGGGWGCGPGWTGGNGIGWCDGMWGGQYGARGTQFMAHGKIVVIDTATSTITITLDGASPNLLTKLGITRTDLPTDVSFQMSSTVKLWGCGWHQGKWGSGTIALASLKQGDVVNLMGYFDKTSGQPVVSHINVWYY
jgi:hypothetical protein